MATNFYTLTLAFLAGVGVFTLYPLALPYVLLLALLAGAFWLVAARAPKAGETSLLMLASLTALGLALAGARLFYLEHSVSISSLALSVDQTITIEGIVVEEPDQRERTTHLKLRTDDTTVLVFADRYVTVAYGDRVSVRGRLSEPEAFTTEFGRVFNYPDYLRAQGVTYRMSFAEVTVLDSGHGNFIVSALLRFKSAFTERTRSLLVEPASGLAEGLLLGVKQALGAELETAFRKTGIIHIVVLSGYNVMLVVAFVLYVLGHFLSPRPRLVFGLLAIAAFALMVGLSATVVRASIMASLVLLAVTFKRQYLVLRGLVLAAVVMVAINPLVLLYDVGFQLSFLATLGLILVAPHFERWLHRVPNWVGARSFVVATVATQLAVLPLLLYQIGELSVVAVVVNVLVLPMVPVAMFLTFVTGMVAFVAPTLAALISLPTYWSLIYIIEIAEVFAATRLAAFTVPSFPVQLVFIGYALMGWWLKHKYDPTLPFGEGDLAERLVAKGAGEAELKDWEIVEEIETSSATNDTKSTDSKSDPKAQDPIFFR